MVISLAEAQRTIKIINESATLQGAADKLEISIRGLHMRRRAITEAYGLECDLRRRDYTKPPKEPRPALTFPDFPPEGIPVQDKIELARKKFKMRRASYDAHTWFPIVARDKLPVGLCWFGDPHVDDDSCDWDTLTKDSEICAATEGIWGCNVGDTTNNWQGRLVRLYAEQDASVSTAREFAEWLMLGSGIRWLIWLLGNHDAWGDGSAILAQMAKRFGTHKLICHDWEARFTLRFPGGWEPRIYTAHNFKGTSIYNIMHGLLREGLMGDDADLYVCGDKHNSGSFEWENPARGHWQNFVRVRGYKFMDKHALHSGFKEQRDGCSILTIFDPINRTIKGYTNIEEGAEILTWKRQRAKK